MPHSLRVRLRKIYEKGLDHYLLTDKDVDRLIKALDVVDGLEDAIAEIEDVSDFCECMPYGKCISPKKVAEIIRKHTGVSE